MLVTLDLEVYKAARRIIVPADIEFPRFHKVLQSVFDWQSYHLYDFTIFDSNRHITIARIVPFEDDLEYDEDAILMKGHTLSEFYMIETSIGNREIRKGSLADCLQKG